MLSGLCEGLGQQWESKCSPKKQPGCQQGWQWLPIGGALWVLAVPADCCKEPEEGTGYIPKMVLLA